jgi:peptide/nickel transport system substrate-binding protein
MAVSDRLRAALLSAAAVVMATSCGTGAAPQGGSQASVPPGGTANVRIRGPVGTLELTTTQLNVTAIAVAQSLYDTLVALDPDTALPIPYLARSWSQTPTEIVFRLRTDATCADGTPVTATVVKNSLDAFIKSSPAVATTIGAGPFTVAANDSAATVTFSSKTPNSEMIYGFTQAGMGIMCPAGLVDTSQQRRKSFGSGPFVIDSFSEGVSFTVRVRPEWKWGPKGTTARTPGFPDRIVFKSVDNETTAANLLLTGGLDISEVSGLDVERLLADRSVINRSQSNAVASPLLMQMSPGRVAADEAVRRAIFTALDPTAFNRVQNNGRGRVPTGGFLVKGARCYDDSLGKLMPQHSADRAAQILTAAGYVAGPDKKFSKNGKPLALQVLGQQVGLTGAEYISETLNAVGFTATLNVVDAAQFSTLVRTLNFDVTQLTIGSQTSTWGAYLPFIAGGKLVTQGGVNRTGVFDPVIDQAYSSYLSATSSADQCRYMSEFQRQLLQGYDVMPMVAGTTDFFARNFAPYSVAWQIRRTKA